jgi:hypothetical protein
MSLEVTCPDYLAAVRTEADRLGQRQSLEEKLAYLDSYGLPGDRCVLSRDFAPLSFRFVIWRTVNGVERRLVKGGLVYHPESEKWRIHS